MMLSDDLKEALKSESKEYCEYGVIILSHAIADAIPRIEELERLLKEWMTADPPEKYDDRVVRTQKALEDTP